jgi:hypothetical protein
MQYLPIPFTALDKSADKPGQSTWHQGQFDGYWQRHNTADGPRFLWTKRPGLTEFCNLGEGAPVNGLYFWTRQDRLFSVCNGKVFVITEAGAETHLTGAGSLESRQTTGNRPTFADVLGTNLYIASGGKISEFTTTTAAVLSDTDAPTAVRFIGTINQTLTALRDNSERFDWADATTPTVWSGEYATAQASPDLTRAMIIANQYLYFFGQNTIEAWRDDGSTFVRESQGAIEIGTLARYSVANILGALYFVDSSYEISRLQGFQVQNISNPNLSRYLRSFATVEDAIGDALFIDGKQFYILSFPGEQKTLVYDIAMNQWYEWSYWNQSTAEREMFSGLSVANANEWKKTFIGDRANGKVYEMTGTTDDGDDIKTEIITDEIDRGYPDQWKFCSEINLTFRRADTAQSPKKMSISWRDNGETAWSATEQVEIESIGKTTTRVNLRRLGAYKSRVWRFTMTDATQAALIEAKERFEIGR